MSLEPYACANRVFWVVDNGSSHRGQAAINWMSNRWPTAHMVHTPVHASWLNQCEIYFSVVQRKVVTPNDFYDLTDLENRLIAFQDFYNAAARPFTWKYTTNDLLTRIAVPRTHPVTGARRVTPDERTKPSGLRAVEVIGHDTDMANVQLRPARAAEADLLSELALRSKAHWGYDRSFLDACRPELTFQPDELRARRIVVAESAGRVLGFYSLDGKPPNGELGNMWVEPDSIGVGVGRRLWHHAIQIARAAGFTMLRIDADPFAEGYYLAMGAEHVGQTPSGSIPDRVLAMLEVRLT